MKAILMSIQSKWLAKILNGDKTIELRKRFPKDYRGWVYLYCTKGKERLVNLIDDSFYCGASTRLNGKVVAKFTLNYVSTCLNTDYGNEEILKNACLTKQELDDYVGKRKFFAWHIENLVIFDKPKELGEFYKPLCEYYQDGICIRNANKMGCEDSKKDINPDGSVNVYQCNKPKKSITIAPQSWQYIYIEEV